MQSTFLPRFYIFLLTAGAVFVAVLLLYAGLRLPSFLHSLPSSDRYTGEKPRPDPLEKVRGALIQKENTYTLSYKNEREDAFRPSWGNDINSYIVVDYDTGEIVAEKNASKKTPIASITKLMTAVVALDLAEPSKVLTAPEDIRSIAPTHIAIFPGEKFTVEELVRAALITSANDAAEVLKNGLNDYYDGHIFVQAMNEKARMLGMQNTSFTNPQGFDSKSHYSSTHDLAILSHYALENYPLIQDAVNEYMFSLSENSDHRGYNWNGLLGTYPGVSGVKIGNTAGAGNTTVVLANREGKKMLVALLGAPTVLERDLWAAELLDFGFEQTANLARVGIGQSELRAKYKEWQNL